MDASILISAIIIIAAVAVLLIVVKRIFAVIGIVLLGLFVLCVVCGFFVYKDFQDFEKNSNGTMAYLLQKDNAVITAIAISPKNNEMTPLSNLKAIELKNVTNGMASSAKKEYYRIITIDEKAFDNLKNQTYSYGMDKLSKVEIFSILHSVNPVLTYANIKAGKDNADINTIVQGIRAGIKDDSEIKSYLFATLLSEATNEDPMFLYTGLNSKTISVYPETALFTAIRIMPVFLVERLTSKLNNGKGAKI